MAEMKQRRGRRQFGATRKLPSGRWQASYLAPDGKRRSGPTTFGTKADASAWLARMETEVRDGQWRAPEPGHETFSQYGTRWLAHRVDLRPSTRELYEILWRVWLEPSFGEMPLVKMTPGSWRAWFVEQTTEHPGSTQPGKAYRLARAMLNTAVEDDLLPSNPCRVKGAGKDTAPERPTASPEQVARVVEAIDTKYALMVELAAYRGLRFGELAGLRRRRVDLLHGTIAVEENAVELAGGRVEFGPPKTAAGQRTIALDPDLAKMVEAHLAEHVGTDPDALLFTSPEGHPLRRTKFRHRWLAACSAAKVPGLHFHDLRGSCLTLAAQTGATTAELMHLAGHTTPTVAMRYQHATVERDRAIADRLAQMRRAAAEDAVEPASADVSAIG